MNRYKLSKAGISVSEGIARFGGNADIYENFLKRFLGEPHFKQMCDAITRRDVSSAFEAAHALKGEVGNLSMNRLYASLCPLVDELRNESFENSDAMMAQVEKDYFEVVAALS